MWGNISSARQMNAHSLRDNNQIDTVQLKSGLTFSFFFYFAQNISLTGQAHNVNGVQMVKDIYLRTYFFVVSWDSISYSFVQMWIQFDVWQVNVYHGLDYLRVRYCALPKIKKMYPFKKHYYLIFLRHTKPCPKWSKNTSKTTSLANTRE